MVYDLFSFRAASFTFSGFCLSRKRWRRGVWGCGVAGAVRLQNCLIIKCKKRSRQREKERGREDRVGGRYAEWARDRDKVFVEGHTRSLKVSNALEVVDSLAISLALPVAIVAFALCIFLFLLLLFFSYLFCTVHWACCCCFCLHCCCRYCILFICVCVCVKNLLLCVFIFRHCLYECVCVLCKVKVIKLYAQFILHSPHRQQQKQQQLSRKNRHEIIV